MGLLKGPVTFSRYRIVGVLPDHFPEFFNERIRRHAFQNVWRTTDEKAAGWTSVENGPDTDFPYASYAQGRYMLFSLRIDRKSVAPSLLRLRTLEAERKQLAESGQKKLYLEQREAIRESVRLELLGKTLPVPAFHEICWSVPDNVLTFCCLSDKVAGELQELFRESFSLGLSPHVPWDIEGAGANLQGAAAGSGSRNLSSSPLPPGIDPLTVGREFLTWLWFKSEERNGMIRIPGGDESEIFFVRRLVLEAGEGEYAETVVCQGLHADLKEGKEALRRGKKISAARLRMAHDRAEWEFTFKADRFHFQSMKLPAVAESEEEETDREGQMIERIYLIEKAAGMMDQFFLSFMGLRSSNGWEKEQVRMQKWIAQSKED
ncbi:MAG: recombination-associated protein RdgC [Deltaproteobacteria bacterium]|nr:recombination-associated protein RdgC [Deltaproteobacteria bacterium]